MTRNYLTDLQGFLQHALRKGYHSDFITHEEAEKIDQELKNIGYHETFRDFILNTAFFGKNTFCNSWKWNKEEKQEKSLGDEEDTRRKYPKLHEAVPFRQLPT